MQKIVAALIASIALCASAAAQTVVTDPWARATVPAQQSGGAYLTLRSPDAARLLAASSPVASNVQLHTMTMNGSTMSMREVAAVDLPAGQPVHDFHIMLLGLKQPLKEGASIPLSVVIEHQGGKRETLQVAVPVKPLTYRPAMHH